MAADHGHAYGVAGNSCLGQSGSFLRPCSPWGIHILGILPPSAPPSSWTIPHDCTVQTTQDWQSILSFCSTPVQTRMCCSSRWGLGSHRSNYRSSLVAKWLQEPSENCHLVLWKMVSIIMMMIYLPSCFVGPAGRACPSGPKRFLNILWSMSSWCSPEMSIASTLKTANVRGHHRMTYIHTANCETQRPY